MSASTRPENVCHDVCFGVFNQLMQWRMDDKGEKAYKETEVLKLGEFEGKKL